jgi:large repetitive protein
VLDAGNSQQSLRGSNLSLIVVYWVGHASGRFTGGVMTGSRGTCFGSRGNTFRQLPSTLGTPGLVRKGGGKAGALRKGRPGLFRAHRRCLDFLLLQPYKPATFVRSLDMAGLLARLRRSLLLSRRTVRRTAPDVEPLELRAQPATAIAPDLVAGSDTGVSSMDNITSATTPRFAGVTTSPAGTTITLVVDGAADGSYVVPHSGGSIFALDPMAPLADGSHVVEFFDSHTHRDSAFLTMAVETTPPAPSADFNVDPANATTTATSLLFDGTGAPRTTATLVFDGAIEATAPVAADGSYRFVVDPVAPGAHEAYVTLTDLAGNVSAPSAPVDVTVAQPPTLALTGSATAVAGVEYDLSLDVTDPGNEPITGWQVDWGDGSTRDLPGIANQATHVYAAAGTFTPTVTALQGTLPTSAAGPTISVSPAPPPTLSQGLIPALQTQEDTTATFAVSDLVADVGVVGTPGHVYGLAVDGVDDTNGTWQYSPDDTNWTSLAGASPTNAQLLSEGSFLRFIPDADYSGQTQLTARIWDQADPTLAGSTVDLSADAAYVSASDATISLDVTHVNAAPTIALPAAQTMFRSQALPTPIAVADVDDPVLNVALDADAGTLTAPANAAVTATGSGTAHVQLTGPTAALNFVLAGIVYESPATLGTENLQVHVTDFAAEGGTPATTSGTLAVTVVDQAPTIVSTPSYKMNANATLTVSAPGLMSAFRDADGDPLQIRLVTAPSVGTLTLHADGTFTYTPQSGYVGKVQFTVEAWDGYELSSPLTVTIDVISIFGLRR